MSKLPFMIVKDRQIIQSFARPDEPFLILDPQGKHAWVGKY